MEMKRRGFLQLLAATPLAALVPWQPPPPRRRVRVVRNGLVFRSLRDNRPPTPSVCWVEFSDDAGATWTRSS